MPELRSADGRYLCADQGDGNFVVYVTATMTPAWDRWSHEAGEPTPAPTPQPDVQPMPSGGGSPIRITSEQDVLVNRTAGYWSNACVAPNGSVYVFVPCANGPVFFRVDKDRVARIGKMLPYAGTGEGWYWDREGWIYLCDGPSLRRVNPLTTENRIVMDISSAHPGCRLWQAHSSDDGQTHAATIERITPDGPYQRIGTAVSRHGKRMSYAARGTLDESQVDASGRWLIIKEDDDNRIINLETRETQMIRQADGAVGHSDCGDGLVVGEDDQHGACVLWSLREPLIPERRRELFKTWAMGHVSIRAGRCLHSDAADLSLIPLDGSAVAWRMSHGMTGSGYDHQVQANLDPSGRGAFFLSNHAGQLDAYWVWL